MTESFQACTSHDSLIQSFRYGPGNCPQRALLRRIDMRDSVWPRLFFSWFNNVSLYSFFIFRPNYIFRVEMSRSISTHVVIDRCIYAYVEEQMGWNWSGDKTGSFRAVFVCGMGDKEGAEPGMPGTDPTGWNRIGNKKSFDEEVIRLSGSAQRTHGSGRYLESL